MDKKFNFLMAIHFHQPVDNFGFVFEKISDQCYEPFLYVIEEFPDIKFNLHYSGSLLEWFKEYRPHIIDAISRLVEKGQVEIIGGGFYEPIISAIPAHDAIGQIRMMSDFLRDNFGMMPQGAWLAERVWESYVPEILSDSGIKYTIIDDQHLAQAGCQQNQIYGHYITEHNLKSVDVIPSDKFLRYAIPFNDQQKTLDYFKKIKQDYKMNTVCYGDDGEKFGAWPDTYKSVYEKGWLKKFLQLLASNSSWIKTQRISDYLKENTPNQSVYIPSISYFEMNKWSLPAESAQQLEKLQEYLQNKNMLDKYSTFLKAGIWKNFLVKYPEINHIHKRACQLSSRLQGLEQDIAGKDSADTDISYRDSLSRARAELYKAQCNCAYWHGVFGGLYLYHLRASLYKRLINAENILEASGRPRPAAIEIREIDFNCDGVNEFIVNTSNSIFVIEQKNGATVTEWSLKKRPLNILNTMSRKKEFYHKSIRKKLYYDNHRRALFIDHFFNEHVTAKALSQSTYKECGDFAGAFYQVVQTEDNSCIETQRQGTADGNPISIKKSFAFGREKETLKASYEITNLSHKKIQLFFGPELNFSVTQDDRTSSLTKVKTLTFHDKIEDTRIDISFSKTAGRLFRYPVYTVSQTQKKPETNYQATCIIPVFDIVLDKNASTQIEISITVKPAY
jgi:4-alpha-glucanotransferase